MKRAQIFYLVAVLTISMALFVRFTPQSAGAKSGNVTNASTGATTNNVAVSGTGVAGPTLGNYPNTMVVVGANTTVTPDAAPTGATSIKDRKSTRLNSSH